jgi:ABC-type transporter lipoprotein component MlaA
MTVSKTSKVSDNPWIGLGGVLDLAGMNALQKVTLFQTLLQGKM